MDFSQGALAHEHVRLTHNRFGESTGRSVMFARGQTRNFEYAFNSKDLGRHVAGYPAHLTAVHRRDRGTFLEGGIRTGERGTDLMGATPSVGNGNWFLTANRSPTRVTDLRDGFIGQEVIIVCGETHTTVDDGGPLHLNGPFRCTADATLTLLSPGGKSWVELTRSVN